MIIDCQHTQKLLFVRSQSWMKNTPPPNKKRRRSFQHKEDDPYRSERWFRFYFSSSSSFHPVFHFPCSTIVVLNKNIQNIRRYTLSPPFFFFSCLWYLHNPSINTGGVRKVKIRSNRSIGLEVSCSFFFRRVFILPANVKMVNRQSAGLLTPFDATPVQ